MHEAVIPQRVCSIYYKHHLLLTYWRVCQVVRIVLFITTVVFGVLVWGLAVHNVLSQDEFFFFLALLLCLVILLPVSSWRIKQIASILNPPQPVIQITERGIDIQPHFTFGRRSISWHTIEAIHIGRFFLTIARFPTATQGRKKIVLSLLYLDIERARIMQLLTSMRPGIVCG